MTKQIDKLMDLASNWVQHYNRSGDGAISDGLRQALRDVLDAALNPKDWRLVPAKATNDMCSRANATASIDFDEAAEAGELNYEEFRHIWKAMLAAAPTPPEAV